MSELDNGVKNLQAAKAKLEVYRQAVLKQAFEGKLTEEWRKKQRGLPNAEELLEAIRKERVAFYERQLEEWKKAVKDWEGNGKEGRKPRKPRKMKELPPLREGELERLEKLPNGWVWCKMGNLAHKIQIGPFGTQLHKHEYKNEGIPVINPKHIKKHKIYPKIFISKEKAASIPQYFLETNDIILGRRGEMGRSAYISEKEGGWFCGTGSLYIRLGKLFDGELFSRVLAGKRVVKHLEKEGSGTTMTNLNSTILNNLPIPVISKGEQTQIVREIESRLSVADRLLETIEVSLGKSEGLRQSILKRAFEGRLI